MKVNSVIEENNMATEKTRLLDTCVVTIPKQIYLEDEENK